MNRWYVLVIVVLGLFVLTYLGATGALQPRSCAGETALSTWEPNDGAGSAIVVEQPGGYIVSESRSCG